MDINQLANNIMEVLRKLEKDVKQENKQSQPEYSKLKN